MKLNLHDDQHTVITSIDTEVDMYSVFETEINQYVYYVLINGLELRYTSKDKQKLATKDLNKLINKGAYKVYKNHYSEEDEGWAAGVAADCANPKLHGRLVCVCLAGAASSSLYWDYYKQEHVNSLDELTPVGDFYYNDPKTDVEHKFHTLQAAIIAAEKEYIKPVVVFDIFGKECKTIL